MEVKYIEELRGGLIKVLDNMPSAKERKAALRTLVECCILMEMRQQLGVVTRERYHQMVLPVFNFLRRNRQLARRVGQFDKDVKLVLSCTLSKLLVEYGAGED